MLQNTLFLLKNYENRLVVRLQIPILSSY